ncbi:SURF1 family protein [Rhizobium sp. YIM 134829]|uniref:SURF1 family protein n=1 Tax=Rhizobium sp. YIM 134829 TaxID=3390453 RepID=UPI0039788820
MVGDGQPPPLIREPASRPSRRGRSLVAGVLVLAALALLVSLGTWQLQRLHWKEGLIAAIAERRSAPPASVDEIASHAGEGAGEGEGSAIDFRAVTVSGTFRHAGERHFFATYQGRTGFYVYTPLALDDGRLVFVNRGFVPYEQKEPATRPGSQPDGAVTITGLARARLDAKPSWVVPENDLSKNIFYWKDLAAMTTSDGLDPGRVLPFFIDADATPNPSGLPIGGVTQFDLPNNHLQYALTWYGLAAALLAVSALFLFRRRRDAQ